MKQERCEYKEGETNFILPVALLDVYPELVSLIDNQTKLLVSAIYNINRMLQSVLDTLHRGQPIHRLSLTPVTNLMVLLDHCLDQLRGRGEASSLTPFLAAEEKLFGRSCARWPDIRAQWWPPGADRLP